MFLLYVHHFSSFNQYVCLCHFAFHFHILHSILIPRAVSVHFVWMNVQCYEWVTVTYCLKMKLIVFSFEHSILGIHKCVDSRGREKERKFHRVWYFGFFLAIDHTCCSFFDILFLSVSPKGHFGYSCGSNAIKINMFSGQTLSFFTIANGDFVFFF